MSLEIELRDRLLADAAIEAKVNDRAYAVFLPEGVTNDSFTYERVRLNDQERASDMEGEAGPQKVYVQIASWSKSYTGAQELDAAVAASLSEFSGLLDTITVQGIFDQGAVDDFEDATEFYRIMRQFEIWFVD
jgi:hypothetical protein